MASSVPSLGYWRSFRGFVSQHKGFVIIGLTMLGLILVSTIGSMLSGQADLQDMAHAHAVWFTFLILLFLLCVWSIGWAINLDE